MRHTVPTYQVRRVTVTAVPERPQWQVAARIASEHNATRRAACHALTRLATIDQVLLLLPLLRSAVDRVDCVLLCHAIDLRP